MFDVSLVYLTTLAVSRFMCHQTVARPRPDLRQHARISLDGLGESCKNILYIRSISRSGFETRSSWIEFTSPVTWGNLLAYRIKYSVQSCTVLYSLVQSCTLLYRPHFACQTFPSSVNPAKFLAVFINMPPNVDGGTVQSSSRHHTRCLQYHFIILTFMSRSPQSSSLWMFSSQYSALV